MKSMREWADMLLRRSRARQKPEPEKPKPSPILWLKDYAAFQVWHKAKPVEMGWKMAERIIAFNESIGRWDRTEKERRKPVCVRQGPIRQCACMQPAAFLQFGDQWRCREHVAESWLRDQLTSLYYFQDGSKMKTGEVKPEERIFSREGPPPQTLLETMPEMEDEIWGAPADSPAEDEIIPKFDAMMEKVKFDEWDGVQRSAWYTCRTCKTYCEVQLPQDIKALQKALCPTCYICKTNLEGYAAKKLARDYPCDTPVAE